MADQLKEIFRLYAEAIQAKLHRRTAGPKVKGPLRLLVNKRLELQLLIQELEDDIEFRQLVMETTASMSGDYHRSVDRVADQIYWGEAVGHFFRRSGYYLDVFEEKEVDIDAAFQRYSEAFQRREIQTHYLALMDGNYFAESAMNFESFTIQRFSADELSIMFGNRVSEVFYPWAMVDVNWLQHYWFICLHTSTPAPRITVGLFLEDFPNGTEPVAWQATKYPRVVEDVLRHLALYKWTYRTDGSPHEPEELVWKGLSIPFILQIDDYLLGTPPEAPDISILRTLVYIDPTGDMHPAFTRMLDESQTQDFKTFIQHTGTLLNVLRVRPSDWQFLDNALNYLVKAFCTTELEELLWHITTLEALLGDRESGVTDPLAKRIARILGKTNNERNVIIKEFKALYNLRSALVHGRSVDGQIHQRHLDKARDLARRTLLWFLHYLAYVHAEIPDDQLPTRQNILQLIDMDQQDRSRLGRLINSLPTEFPHPPDWMEKAN